MKIFNGSAWSEAKNLKIYNGSSFVNAKKSWLYDGSVWRIHYPNYPATQGIATSISGNQVVGSTLTAIWGNWNSDPAYSPESYTYQWYKNGSSISGATNNTYVTQVSDVGSTITVTVTAVNQRGSTPSASSNSIIVTPSNLSGLSLTDSTSTPSAPTTVSVTGGTNAWSASWTNTGASTYGVRTNNGSVSYSGGTSATGYSASAGSATVYVKSINTSGLVSVSWSSTAGAAYYNVSWSGGNSANVYGTSTTISWSTGSSLSVTVTPMSSNGYGGGNQSSSITPSQKESAENSGSATIVDPVYAPSYAGFTESGFQGSVLTYPNSSSYSYPTYIVRPGTTLSISSPYSNGTAPVTYSYQWQQNGGGGWSDNGSTGSSYTLPAGFASAGYEYRCAVTATNTAGSATSYSSSTGAVVHVSGTSKAPTGGSWSNNISPTGGTLYISEPSNSYGVGSGYENWNYSPTWGYDIYIYRSTTSGGTYTLHSNSVKTYNGGGGQTQTKTTAGWYYAVVYTYNGNSVNGNSLRIPSSGGFQLT